MTKIVLKAPLNFSHLGSTVNAMYQFTAE